MDRFLVSSLSLAFLFAAADLAIAGEEVKKAPADPELQKDFEGLQGTWMHFPREGGRVVKVHKGNRTTLTRYGPDGTISFQKQSAFKLEKSGEVKIFTFGSSPDELDDKNATMSYIYRLKGNTLYEVPALLLDRHSYTDTPSVIEWQRTRKPTKKDLEEALKK